MSDFPVYNKILLIVAMQAEGEAIIKKLQLQPITAPKPLLFYGSSDQMILLSFNGKHCTHNVDNIGTDIATLNTYLSIQQFRPDLVINFGTAGGFHKMGASIGDLYLAKGNIYYHDRKIPISKAYENYALGNFKTFNTSRLAQVLNCKTGSISTSNSISYTPEEMAFMLRNNIALKDMEAAAIANICELFNTPLIILKSITDLVDTEENAASFMSNFNRATNTLTAGLLQLLHILQSR